MDRQNGYEDPIGFTKQTAMMLTGLGAGDLIPQFKRRNISTEALLELGKDDLIVLGADENRANDLLRQLSSASRKNVRRHFSDERKTNELINVLVYGNNQLNIIETFVAYARLRLVEKPDDFVIDTRKKVRASQALCFAADHTIAEVEELEKNFVQLRREFSDSDRRTAQMSSLLKLIKGIGLIAGLLCTLRYARLAVGSS